MTRPGRGRSQASVQDVEKLRESMGLNEPMLVQYKDYVLGVLQGDFGTSYSYNQPVLKLVAERIPNTLLLAIPSIAVALLIGMVIGVVSAVKQGSLFDYIFMILALIGGFHAYFLDGPYAGTDLQRPAWVASGPGHGNL